jgi:hypothetical protein
MSEGMAHACAQGGAQDAKNGDCVSALGVTTRTNRDAYPGSDSSPDQVTLIGADRIGSLPANLADTSTLEPKSARAGKHELTGGLFTYQLFVSSSNEGASDTLRSLH